MLRGCDISLWNGSPDFDAVKSAGMDWLSIKASEANFYDPCWIRNARAARDAGLLVMPYHFLEPNMAAEVQFARFDSAIQQVGGYSGFIAPALDVEGDANCSLAGMSSDGYCGLASDFMQMLNEKIGRKGVCYTYPSFASEHGVGGAMGDKSLLWCASYGANPQVFGGWDDWAFWQYSADGSWAGIGGGLDMDQFNGDMAALQALVVGGVAPAQVTKIVKLPAPTTPPYGEIDCKPLWSQDRITVEGAPVLAALSITTLCPVVHADTGRAYLREMEPYCAPWRFVYHDTKDGPRVYCTTQAKAS